MEIDCKKHGTIIANPDSNGNVMCPFCRAEKMNDFLKNNVMKDPGGILKHAFGGIFGKKDK